MDNIVYIKKLDDYDEIEKGKLHLPFILKKMIFLYKNIFNIVIKKSKDKFTIWILPFQEKISKKKLEKIINKQIKKHQLTKDTKLVVANCLVSNHIIDIFKKYNVNYFNGNLIKKILLLKVLDYINHLQNEELNKRNITILVNENNDINDYIIKNIAVNSKITKVVSKKIYQFRNLEEELYNDYGIAIQFSNSYQKSLLKSDIIINLDFNEMEINEYVINPFAIIINTSDYLKISSKLFKGIVINSYRIKFSQELRDEFTRNHLLHRYENLVLYESIINWKNGDYHKISQKIDNDNIKIMNLIGNNGIINKQEFKTIIKQKSIY